MQPSDSGLQYLVPSDPSPHSPLFRMNQRNTAALFELNRSSNIPLYNFYIAPPSQLHEISPHSSCISRSSNSTSDEADEQQFSVINERKQKRMISNRESARRSRMRKQRHLDELSSRVLWLRNENQQLIDKLKHVSESRDKVLRENAHLQEEASQLRQLISDMQLSSPVPVPGPAPAPAPAPASAPYSTLKHLECGLSDN